MDDIELDGKNPLRPVDWRFQIARRLVSMGRSASRTRHDVATYATAQYLWVHQWQSRRDLSAARYPFLRRAVELHESEPSRLRAVIEAAVLTGDEPRAIAERLGIEEECLRWYEQAFFDVRDRLGHPAFIVHHVLERARLQSNGALADYGWKLVAYLGGFEALEVVLGCTKVEGMEPLQAKWHDEIRAVMLSKLRSASDVLPADHAKAWQQTLSLKDQGDGSTVAKQEFDALTQGIDAMMKALPFRVEWQSDPDSPFREFEELGVELNTAEQICIILGGKLPNAEELKTLRFPEPTRPGAPHQADSQT